MRTEKIFINILITSLCLSQNISCVPHKKEVANFKNTNNQIKRQSTAHWKNKINKYIENLGSRKFAIRKKAENTLKNIAEGKKYIFYYLLGYLKNHRDTLKPEVKNRLLAVLRHTYLSLVAENFHILKTNSKNWYKSVDDFCSISFDKKNLACRVRLKDGGSAIVKDNQIVSKKCHSIPERSHSSFLNDGRLVYLCSAAEDTNLYSAIIVDKNNQETIIGENIAMLPVSNSDGTKIAYKVIGPNFPGEKDCYVVLNGKAGKKYDIVSDVLFSSNGNLAYIAGERTINPGMALLKYEDWFVVLNGIEQKKYCCGVGHPTFSPDGKLLAYWSFVGPNKRRINIINTSNNIEDNEEPYDSVWEPRFSPDGKKLAYQASNDNKWFVILNKRKIGGEFDAVQNLVFSPDSENLAFAGAIGKNNDKKVKKWFVILNGATQLQPFEDGFDSPPDYLTFSPDSKQLAYIGEKNNWKFLIINNIIQKNPFTKEQAYKNIWSLSFDKIYTNSIIFSYLITKSTGNYAIILKINNKIKQISLEWFKELNFDDVRPINLDGVYKPYIFIRKNKEWYIKLFLIGKKWKEGETILTPVLNLHNLLSLPSENLE